MDINESNLYLSLLLITLKDISNGNKFLLLYYLINVWVSDSFIRIWLWKSTKKGAGRMISFFKGKEMQAKYKSRPVSDYAWFIS